MEQRRAMLEAESSLPSRGGGRGHANDKSNME